MRKITWGVIPLVVAVLAAPSAGAHEAGPPPDEDKIVPLEKIISNPRAFRYLTVSFVVQFHRLGRLDNPVYTKFESDWYQNFSVWPDSAPLWERAAYKKDFPYLFISRLSEGAKMILHAPRYSRWIITGTVVDDFAGMPWIEVQGLKQLDTALDPVSLAHLVRGFQLRDEGKLDAAAARFHAAEHPGLPTAIRSMAMREEAMALHGAGKTQLAIARLVTAQRTLPEDPAITAALTICRAALGLDPDGHPLPQPPPPPAPPPPDQSGTAGKPPAAGGAGVSKPPSPVKKTTLEVVPRKKKDPGKKKKEPAGAGPHG